MKKLLFFVFGVLVMSGLYAQKVDYSVVFVPEESGNNITRISTAGDYVCLPIVRRTSTGVSWLSNRILGVSLV